eukprot:gnl/TRDRNA2_/TRDRNA2_172582_c0_seq4.p1 gnl/TRDRNA2_/TRDRNA2_172582_c0~~gnl/TRDRNA2_/TRDRNA2_172582_c0_seq4.p1  ORF type:complete len:401 (-),score=58.56 gnl/TRDRNA2_/TRDRNA2_172582_c0_seq4:673-1875(-)
MATLLEPSTENVDSSVWEVVGGVGRGGIIVRTGLELSSSPADSRLATGARIKQLLLVGCRLHYRLLAGVGPASGWVSTMAGGKELVVPLANKDAGCARISLEVGQEPSEGKTPWQEGRSKAKEDRDMLPHDVPIATWDVARQRVRRQALAGWAMQLCGAYVGPPEHLGSGVGLNPVRALGECGDPSCGNYRPLAPKVRTAFAEYCVEQVSRALPKGVGAAQLPLAYISVGPGALYFDWDLLERLRESLSISVSRIALIDPLYKRPDDRLSQAMTQFEGWFEGADVKWYTSISEFLEGLEQSFLSECAQRCGRKRLYQILMQCDAAQVDIDDLRQLKLLRNKALQPGGLAFVLSNPSERHCWQRRLDGSGVDRVDTALWTYPGWQIVGGSAVQLQEMPLHG